MKQLVIAVAAIVVMAGSAAWAQGFSAEYDTSEYAGVAVGFPFGALYGLSDALGPNVDARFRVGVIPFPGLFAIFAGADILAGIAEFSDGRGSVYVGGGAGAVYTDLIGVAGFGVEASVLLGASLRFSEGTSGFLEGGPSLAYGFATDAYDAVLDVLPRATLGVLFHF